MLLPDLSNVLPLVNSTLITLGVGFVALNQVRNDQSSRNKDTVQILKDNIGAKDIEITQMKTSHDTAIAKLKSDHDTAIASLRAEVATITAQLENLKQANSVLQNTVTGKEALNTIVEIMKPIPAFFATGGYLEEIRLNQQKALKELKEIREAMELTPSIVTPKHEKFVPRGKIKSTNK